MNVKSHIVPLVSSGIAVGARATPGAASVRDRVVARGATDVVFRLCRLVAYSTRSG